MEKSFGRKPAIISRRAVLAGAVGAGILAVAGDTSTPGVVSRVTTEIARGVETAHAAAATLPDTVGAVTAKAARLAQKPQEVTDGILKNMKKELYPHKEVYGQYPAMLEGRLVKKPTGEIQLSKKETVIQFTPTAYKDGNNMHNRNLVIRIGSPSTDAPTYEEKYGVTVTEDTLPKDQFGVYVIGSHTGDHQAERIEVDDQTFLVDLWVEYTDANGLKPRNPVTNEIQLDENGNPERYFASWQHTKNTRPIERNTTQQFHGKN